MATTTVIAGQPTKNNGGTLLNAGTIADSAFVNLSLATNTDPLMNYGSKVHESVSPASSGNVGTFRPLSAGTFGKMEVGQYVGKIVGVRIAGTDNTFLRSGAAETSDRTSLHYARGNRRYDITDWSYTTGAATKGGNEGVLVQYVNPVGGATVAHEPFPTDAVPGELVYMVTGLTADQDDYQPRTNP